MYQMLLYGFLIGIAATLFYQDIAARLDNYKTAKQAEFEAAVKAETDYRRAQAEHRADQDWDALLDNGWSHVEPTDNPRHPSNVRKLAFDSSVDPFADI